MRVLIPASSAATAALVAACNSYGAPPARATAASSTGGRQCFYAPNVSGYRRGPGDTVIVNTNSRDYYQFRTQPYCADRIDWENRIALRSRTGSFICNGYDAEIYVPEAIGAAYCPLYDMRKLTSAEVAQVRATPPRDKR
jgi:hypothetical protein